MSLEAVVVSCELGRLSLPPVIDLHTARQRISYYGSFFGTWLRSAQDTAKKLQSGGNFCALRSQNQTSLSTSQLSAFSICQKLLVGPRHQKSMNDSTQHL